MKTNKTPILPFIPSPEDKAGLSRYMESVNNVLQDIVSNARADLDDVDGSATSLDARVTALESGAGSESIKTTTSSYAVLDDDGYTVVLVDSRGGAATITLPTLADNLARKITVVAEYLGGAITVDGEGAETIDGIASAVLQSKDDFVTILGTSTEWKILSCKQVMSTGWINTNDWTDRELGNINLGYDNLTGTFTVGEVVNEYSDTARTTATGVSGIILSDSGSVLVLKNAVKGTFTNNYYLKGATSAATADVNVATKNVNSNLYHGFGRNLSDLLYRTYFSTDGTENATYHAFVAFQQSNAENGIVLKQVDTNTINAQTGEYGGFLYYDTSGNHVTWDSEDYYYQIKIIFQK